MSETTDEFVARVRNICNQPKPELTAAAPSLLPEALDRLEALQAELELTGMALQDTRATAFAAINPANWQTGDCSDDAKRKHYYETLDEIAKSHPDAEWLERFFERLTKAESERDDAQAELAKARQEEREACARMAEQTPAYSCPFAANWAGPPPETEELCPVCGQDKDGHGGKCVGESSAVALAMAIRARSESDD